MYRKVIILVSCILVFGLAAGAQAGLEGHWKFDEGSGTIAVDSSGKGRDGTISGAEWTGPGWDGTGYCLDFDGQGTDRVSLGTFDVSGDAISIACWFKADNLDTPGNDPRMVSKAIGGNNEEHWFMVSSSRVGDIKVLRFRLKTDGTTGEIKANTTTGTIELDVWIHVAVTWDGSTMRIYKNGVEVGSLAKGGTLSTNSTAKVAIGNQPAGTGGDRPFDGLIDEVLICNQALSADQVQDLVNGIPPEWIKASEPTPADGALYANMWVNLGWSTGETAVSHDVYLGNNFDDVNKGTADMFRGNQPLTPTTFFAGFFGNPYPDGLVPGTTYYWRIDEVEADGTTIHKGNIWSFTIPSKKAYGSDPPDGSKFIDPNVTLSWTAGLGAKLRYVYFGDNFDDVNSAVDGLQQADTTYSPGTLEFDKTYYWRVDESDGITMQKGDVWSFKTLPVIPITDPNLIGWWKLDEGMGTTAVDWSGHEHHGILSGPDWVDGYDGGALDFITGENDRVSVGSFDVVGNGITLAAWVNPRSFIIGDARIISKATSSDGNDHWWMLSTIEEDHVLRFRLKTDDGQDTTTYIAPVGGLVAGEWAHVAATWDGSTMLLYKNGLEIGRTAKGGTAVATSHTVKVAIGNQPVGVGGGTRDFDGLIDDIRVYNRGVTAAEIPDIMRGDLRLAWDPSPANGSTPYIREATPLNWSPGENASGHDVYLGIDRGTVADANASDTTGIYRGRQFGTSYTPPDVEWGGGPYYWRIDEYNTDATISEGRIWSFTVADFIEIEDFEDYNDFEPDRIFDTWLDGWGVDTNGSEVGYADPNFDQGEHFVETTIVHGGSQSMPYFYENNFKYSEATYSPTQRDWTEEGVGVLSLWFISGDAANAAEQMYVALNGGTAVYNDNANASQINTWTEWTIDLQEFTGVNLANVNTLAIGFGDKNNLQAGGSGLVLFDDIRLYRPAEPQP